MAAVYRAEMHHCAQFRQAIVELLQFFKMTTDAILDLFGIDLENPRRVFDGLYQCAKFGCNRCCSLENIEV